MEYSARTLFVLLNLPRAEARGSPEGTPPPLPGPRRRMTARLQHPELSFGYGPAMVLWLTRLSDRSGECEEAFCHSGDGVSPR